jgi:hypothetical protein
MPAVQAVSLMNNHSSQGKTIREAFEAASNSPEIKPFKCYNITPLLDDDGNGYGHATLNGTGDGKVAKDKYICIQGNGHSYNNYIPAIRLEGV